MTKKQCLWPGDGEYQVVVPKIESISKWSGVADGKYRIWVFTGQNAESDADLVYRYDTIEERDAAYDSLISAIRAWWEE